MLARLLRLVCDVKVTRIRSWQKMRRSESSRYLSQWTSHVSRPGHGTATVRERLN